MLMTTSGAGSFSGKLLTWGRVISGATQRRVAGRIPAGSPAGTISAGPVSSRPDTESSMNVLTQRSRSGFRFSKGSWAKMMFDVPPGDPVSWWVRMMTGSPDPALPLRTDTIAERGMIRGSDRAFRLSMRMSLRVVSMAS
jgi:hypothetical protein